MHDALVEKLFEAIRSEDVTVTEKVKALVRAGQIAHAYVGESQALLESVFGDSFQNDIRAHNQASQH